MYLQLGATEVRCAGGARGVERVESVGRSNAGALGSRTLARKRAWEFTTAPMLLADGETLRGLLDGTTRTASGDFAPDASVSVVGEFGGADFVQLADGLNVTIKFILREV